MSYSNVSFKCFIPVGALELEILKAFDFFHQANDTFAFSIRKQTNTMRFEQPNLLTIVKEKRIETIKKKFHFQLTALDCHSL